MADLSTIARPYAKAVFELASSAGALDAWSEMLELLAAISVDDHMQSFASNPKYTSDQVSDLILGVAGDKLTDQGKNIVKLLAENHRVNTLPDIAALFEMFKAEAEGTVDVEVKSVEPLTEQHKQELGASLRKKLGRDVRMTFELDSTLIGGALITAGDLVIDGTVRGRLEKLSASLGD